MREPTMMPLTPDEKNAIRMAGDVVETMLAAWRIVVARHGQDWDELVMIDPTEYVMPKDDWLWVAERLVARTTCDPLSTVNGLLEWMNRGPSAAA